MNTRKGNTNRSNRHKWIIMLIVALLLPPLYFALAGGNSEEAREIVSFEELDDSVLNQTVEYGTALDELDLPATLQVVVKSRMTENETSQHEDINASPGDEDSEDITAKNEGSAKIQMLANASTSIEKVLNGQSGATETKDTNDEMAHEVGTTSGASELQTADSSSEASIEAPSESSQDSSAQSDAPAEANTQPPQGMPTDSGDQSTENEPEPTTPTEESNEPTLPTEEIDESEQPSTEETDESEQAPAEETGESGGSSTEETSESGEPLADLADDDSETAPENPIILDNINIPASQNEDTFSLEPATINVTWISTPTYDGNTSDVYVFTPIIPEEYIVSATPPTITVVVKPQMRNTSVIRVTNRDELRLIFSHGAIVGGSLNWSGERLVEMAFSNLGGEINSHENFWSIAPVGTTRTITLVSADDELREIKTTRNSLHFRIGPQVVLKLVDPNLHIVGNNPNASISTEMAGGIRVQGGRLELWEGTIRENYGFWGQNAVYVTLGGSFLMQGGLIENNRSDFGGGMSASGFGTKFDMYGGVFQNNFATIYSGGVDIDAGAEFNMYGGKIINNTADGEGGGGGLRVDSGSLFNMFDGLIEGNKVTSNGVYPTGGGVSVYDPDTTFNMNGGIIRDNSAHRGGGVGVVNAIFNLGTGRTERGRATDGQTGTVNNPVIADNRATSGGLDAALITGGHAGGGGVYVLGTSIANMTNFIMHSGRIEGNTSLYRGGGVYLKSAIMSMKGGSIVNNKTTANSDERSGGGGVYLHNYYADWGFPSKFFMSGGIIRGNESREGGAIKRNDNRLVIDVSGCSVISGNTAHTLGGGISTETTAPNNSAMSTFNIETGRLNLIISESVKFERNRSLAPVSYGLKVSEVKTLSPNLFGRIKWNGKNSVNGQSGIDSSFHLFNNHDIANLMGSPINYEDIEEYSPHEPTLVISKTLRSDDQTGLDFANRETYFDFSVTIAKSKCNPDSAQKYRAYIMDEKGVVVNVNVNFDGEILTDAKHGSYIEFPTGTETKVRLKHGQWLSFVDVERDAKYTVTEYKSPGVTQSCVQKVNGVQSTITSPQDADLTIPETSITDGEDRADFLNMTIQIVPVGIFTGNMPFILLLGAALLTLTSFAACKMLGSML